MAEETEIEWCDSTFNPFIGCTKVGPGCDNCYAEELMDKRMHIVQWGPGQQRHRTGEKNWNAPVRWERDHAAFLAEHGRRRRVFCASLADVFDNEVDPQWRADLFALIRATPNLDWLLLTKRIGNAHEMIGEALIHLGTRAGGAGPTSLLPSWPWPHVWLGATVVNQAEADRDIPKLLAVPARVRFLSIEPMLGAIDLRFHIFSEPTGKWRTKDGKRQMELRRQADGGLHWIIVGGESGPKARPMSPDWARAMRDQCTSAGVPLLFKQWGEWLPMLGQVEGAPVRDKTTTPDGWVMGLAGKKAAGRLLDGIEHNGYPGAA